MAADAASRLCRTAALGRDTRTAIRALLDAAFDGDFTDDDWAHALGGTHAGIQKWKHKLEEAKAQEAFPVKS